MVIFKESLNENQMSHVIGGAILSTEFEQPTEVFIPFGRFTKSNCEDNEPQSIPTEINIQNIKLLNPHKVIYWNTNPKNIQSTGQQIPRIYVSWEDTIRILIPPKNTTFEIYNLFQ